MSPYGTFDRIGHRFVTYRELAEQRAARAGSFEVALETTSAPEGLSCPCLRPLRRCEACRPWLAVAYTARQAALALERPRIVAEAQLAVLAMRWGL